MFVKDEEENLDLGSLSYEELLELIDRERMPRHIAIIMDGNGRWARNRGFLRLAGHREGIKSVRDIVTCCREIGVKVLTIYAFSAENWKRPELEVNTLMMFLEEFLRKELKTLMDNNIRFMTIGQTDKLPESVQRWLKKVIKETENNDAMILNVALSYGGRTEIVEAVRLIARDAASGVLLPQDINSKTFSEYLYTRGLPDPDLMIRTSGETRISNFLLWQMAYTELYFTGTLWPDFRRPDILLAILDYRHRERRFGMVEGEISRAN